MLIGMHILVGAGLGSLAANPALSFAIGAATHFAGDSIPHWEYSIAPLEALKDLHGREKLRTLCTGAVLRVLAILSCEILGTFALALWLVASRSGSGALAASVFAGGLGGLLPDVLWGLADNSHSRILLAYRAFHHRMHTTVHGVGFARGFTWQLAAAAAACALIWFR